MSQPFADALNWVPKSRALATTLARAHDFARAHGDRTVSLEHLLLALLEDPDAASVLQACHVDMARLNGDLSSRLERLVATGETAPQADPGLLRILEYAVAAAQQSKRRDVNGAIVLGSHRRRGEERCGSAAATAWPDVPGHDPRPAAIGDAAT